ncbi:MAG: PDZ domain-containing protein [Nannocystaceae bacterium]|nr:PDZ domain-containing protein [bacterium]
MRATALCCLILVPLACDSPRTEETETSKPTEVSPPASRSPAPKPVPTIDAPAGEWSVTQRHPRLHQLDDAAWSELVLELLSGVVQTAPTEDGMRLVAMGRGSVAEQIGLSPGDVLRSFGTATPPTAENLHKAWSDADRTRWASIVRERGGSTQTLHVWVSGPRRANPLVLAGALAHLGVEEKAPTRRLVDRALLELLGEHPNIGHKDLLWHALGVPDGASVRRVDGENVGMRGRVAALEMIAGRSGERAFELLVADRDRELRLQFEVVTGLIEDATLQEIREAATFKYSRRLLGSAPPDGDAEVDATSIFETRGEHHVAVKAADFRALLADPSTLARAGRIVPWQEDGKTRGFKVYGVRRSSPLRAIGFRNGDKVLEVQGKTLESIERALELYTELSKEDVESITFLVERDGAQLELRVDIE